MSNDDEALIVGFSQKLDDGETMQLFLSDSDSSSEYDSQMTSFYANDSTDVIPPTQLD